MRYKRPSIRSRREYLRISDGNVLKKLVDDLHLSRFQGPRSRQRCFSASIAFARVEA